jgi:hypothetical protein
MFNNKHINYIFASALLVVTCATSLNILSTEDVSKKDTPKKELQQERAGTGYQEPKNALGSGPPYDGTF